MARPLIIDTFPMNDELDMLECRLTELYKAVDWFVPVEADVDHQDHPKPYHYLDNAERFAPWADKIMSVQATGLPTLADDEGLPDDIKPWSREWAQRGFVSEALTQIGVNSHDILLHGDIDEIPTALAARNVRPAPGRFVTFHQRLHCFALDWLHPEPWFGTVAARADTVLSYADNVNPFASMRDRRNRWNQGAGWRTDMIPEAGWHFSWMGGREASLRKLGSFCHPEIADRTLNGLEDNYYMTAGYHVDGRKMQPVEVDESYPKWIRDGKAPAEWYRP